MTNFILRLERIGEFNKMSIYFITVTNDNILIQKPCCDCILSLQNRESGTSRLPLSTVANQDLCQVCKRRLKMGSKLNWDDVLSVVAVLLPTNAHHG